jgi:hypothetical protein
LERARNGVGDAPKRRLEIARETGSQSALAGTADAPFEVAQPLGAGFRGEAQRPSDRFQELSGRT